MFTKSITSLYGGVIASGLLVATSILSIMAQASSVRYWKVTVEAPSKGFVQGQAAEITIKITNSADHPLWALMTSSWQDYNIELKDQAGNTIRMNQDGKKRVEASDIVFRASRKSLPSGKSTKEILDLSSFYDFTAGQYTVVCQRKGALQAIDKNSEKSVEFVRPSVSNGFFGLVAVASFEVSAK